MKSQYDLIYLSPHLDDAALSCGGQIARFRGEGRSVLIVTVTAGDPPMGAESRYIQELLHLTVPDCIYRFDPQSGEPLYQSDPDIFGDVHVAESGLVQALVARLHTLPPAEQVIAPLTVGHHVDHLLTRSAAEEVWGVRLRYYEDYPYAQKSGAVEEIIAQQDSHWSSEVIELSELELQQKIEAIAAFKSQLSTFWKSRAELERQVTGFAQQRGGEKIWVPAG